MTISSFEISKYKFEEETFARFPNNLYVTSLWPVVYLLSDKTIKELYVGETADTISRITTHLKNPSKNHLTDLHLITSEKFNKSATLDIESNLIKYLSGDGQYKLLNANVGIANHTYYQQKEVYWGIFKTIWKKLKDDGLAKNDLKDIDNSDLFKYSPFKSLSPDQKTSISNIIKHLLNDNVKSIVVEGGAGTGKTILAVYLFKILNTDSADLSFKEFGSDELEFIELIMQLKDKYPNPKMALVVPMASFRETIKKVFRNIKGLSAKMVVGPSEATNSMHDIIIVDESHRLRRRKNLGTYFGVFDKVSSRLGLNRQLTNELEWMQLQGKKTLFFYDKAQSIKPSDVRKEEFDLMRAKTGVQTMKLLSQHRVKGGIEYVKYINDLLNNRLVKTRPIYQSKEYEFYLFDSLEDMIERIKAKNIEFGLSRLVAGYSWEWISRTKSAFDINIDNIHLKWNSVTSDWVNSANAVNEVGCIHTTQGYDLNYTGVIFGNEISYDKNTKQIIIRKENYFDRNGKQSIDDPEDLKEYIINIYQTLMLRGMRGTYVYVCDKDLKEYFDKNVELYKNEGAEALPKMDLRHSNRVILYDISVAAGKFSDLQKDPDTEWLELPPEYKASEEYFVCRVKGESMNKIIPNGSLCLFKKDPGGTREGKIVLVQHYDINDSDYGSGYTIKYYHSIKEMTDETWSHSSIILKPLSDDPSYADIVLTRDKSVMLNIVGVFISILKP